MTNIPILKAGDKVSIISTARKVEPEEMKAAVGLLSGWGLRVVVPEGLYAAENQFAGSDSHRARMLQEALDDSDIRAIFCARGGYGTVRIIDRIDFSRFAESPKWIVGYSDVTVLHSHIHRHFGLPTLHATMPIHMSAAPNADTETLHDVLFGKKIDYSWEPHALDRAGKAEGVVVGGNLSILYSLCGSPSAIDTKGKILLIEDLDEYLYHIDRMMRNLDRCGMLEGLAGLIVGGMTDMHDNTVPFGSTAEEIIHEVVSRYGFPVAFHAPFGHTVGANLALPLGTKIRLSVSHLKKSRIFAS